MIRFLLSIGAEINVRGGTFDGTPINLAAEYGHLNAVRALYEAGAELDISKPERNPLFGAIMGRSLETVQFLVACGIDFQVKYTGKSMKGMDAMAFALERGEKKIAEYLRGCAL